LEEHFGSQTFTSNTRFYKLVANLKYGELRLRTTRAATPRSKNAKRFSSADQKPLRQRAVVFRPYNAYGISRDADQVELMLENNYECDFVTYTEKDAEVYFAPDDQINSDIFFVCADPIRAKKIILKIGREFDGKRCFGIIPWEFSELPAHTVSSLKLFEKILCPSRFCTDTFIDAGLENVSTFPNLLFNTPPSHCRVPDQNQDDQFLFYSHVNLASGINRKNPLGFIRAAREFIANRGGCKFLLRILTSDGSENELEEIMTAANDLPNFVVETSDKDDNNFFHSGLQMADVFVSLHRAEGFGRQIAEAMAVKTSVICTNYSGNLDFCDPQNSYLVDGDLITCEPGDYFENEKQLTWFEPDVRHAAALMQQAISMPQERKQKIEAAYKLVEKKFSVSNEMRQVFMKNLGL
jgi:glycosyltransferase involved in cell wall biosynthesis